MEHTPQLPTVELSDLLGEPGRTGVACRVQTEAAVRMHARELEVVKLVLGKPETPQQKERMAEQESITLSKIAGEVDAYGNSLSDVNRRLTDYQDQVAELTITGQHQIVEGLQHRFENVEPTVMPKLDDPRLPVQLLKTAMPEVYPFALQEAQSVLAHTVDTVTNPDELAAAKARLELITNELEKFQTVEAVPSEEIIPVTYEPTPYQGYEPEAETEPIDTTLFINPIDSKDTMFGHEVLHTGKLFLRKMGSAAIHYLVKKPIEKLKTAA